MPQVEIIRARCQEGVAHGFFGRRGGVSAGSVAGLNVGLGAQDEEQSVTENRRRAVDSLLPGASLATIYQVHSARAVVATKPWPLNSRPRADAIVTKMPGLLLGIVTADCAPVLLSDTGAGVVGAAHAGWRGAVGGVIESTVEAMIGLGAHRGAIAAAIGPCIAQASYEVDAAFRENFLDSDAPFFEAGSDGHYQFNLEAYVISRLAKSGIGNIEPLGLDTYFDEDRFFSYRRATHQGAATYGRQFSLIGIPE